MKIPGLNGLSRLLEIVSKYEVSVELLPPGRFPPQAGEKLCGMPIDPQLATAFAGLGKLVVGKLGAESWLLLRCDDEFNHFFKENKEWQESFPHEFWPEHFRALMVFGSELRYRYATVPGLANPQGLQPVVQLDPYEELYALPIASTVDRFFETFSRYLELVADDPGFRSGAAPMLSFPYDVPGLIARDTSLVEMIKAGCFDSLMYERNKVGQRSADELEGTRQWIDRVLGNEERG